MTWDSAQASGTCIDYNEWNQMVSDIKDEWCSGNYATHKADSTIHFTKSSIDDDYQGSSQAILKFLVSSAFKRNNWNSAEWNNSSVIWDNSLSAWKAQKSGAAGGYTDEQAQDAVGNNLGNGLIYNDATPLFSVGGYNIISGNAISGQYAQSWILNTFSGATNKRYITSGVILNAVSAQKLWSSDYISSQKGLYAHFISANNTNLVATSMGGNLTSDLTGDNYTYGLDKMKYISSQIISGGTVNTSLIYRKGSYYPYIEFSGSQNLQVTLGSNGKFRIDGFEGGLLKRMIKIGTTQGAGGGYDTYLYGNNVTSRDFIINATSIDAYPYIKLRGSGNIELSRRIDYISSQSVSSNVIRFIRFSGETDATATELENLTDGSNADALHTHTGVGTDVAWSGASSFYGFSSNAKSLYADSSNIRFRFPGSGLKWNYVSAQNISGQLLALHKSRDISSWNSAIWHNSGIMWDNTLQLWKPHKSGASTGGSSTFVELTDTPSSYAGSVGKIPIVNGAGNALLFVDIVCVGNEVLLQDNSVVFA